MHYQYVAIYKLNEVHQFSGNIRSDWKIKVQQKSVRPYNRMLMKNAENVGIRTLENLNPHDLR